MRTDIDPLVPLAPAEVASLLNGILAGRVDTDAWEHPLGFIHVRLSGSLPRRHKMRLHIWETRQEPTTLGRGGRLHNHAFDFVSHVVAGIVLERRYSVREDIDGTWCCFEVVNSDGRSERKMGPERFAVCHTEEIVHIAGQSYAMAAGDFHDAIALVVPTATVLLARPHPSVRSLLLTEEPDGDYSRPWPRVAAEEVRRKVAGVLGNTNSEHQLGRC